MRRLIYISYIYGIGKLSDVSDHECLPPECSFGRVYLDFLAGIKFAQINQQTEGLWILLVSHDIANLSVFCGLVIG